MLRYVRYVYWVACAAACLIFTWLWARSYVRWDSPYGNIPGVCHVQINSLSGSLYVGVHDPGSEPFWKWRTFRAHGNADWGARRRLGALGFGVSTSTMNPSQTMHFVYVPYWFFVACTGAAALIRRFSMRALLIVMTMVALLLGAIVCALKT